jgi:hypothetical protein
VRCAGGGRDFLLGQPQLEASLAEVRGDGIGLAQLADPRVLVPRRPVLLAARSALAAASAAFRPIGLLFFLGTSCRPAYQFW